MTWLEDDNVKNWLDQIGNKRTKRNYERTFPLFLEFIKKTPRDRALMLVMSQSGFLPSDLRNMRIENFKFYDNEGNWNLPEGEHYYHFQMREKTNIWQCTCLSYEALSDLRMMLAERGFPKKGSLFVSFRNKPLDEREINLAFKSIVERAFPDKTKHYGSPEALETPIREAYKSAFKYLAINGFGTPSHKIDLLEKQFTESKAELAELIAKQQQEIKTLKNLFEIDNLKKLFEQVLDKYTKEDKTKKQ